MTVTQPAVAVLPALIVVLPALLAVLTLLPDRMMRAMPFLAVVATGAMVLALTVSVAGGGPVLTALGGWERPLGIVLRADGMACLFLLLTGVVMTVVAAYARHDRPGLNDDRRARIFWGLWLFLWAGLNAVFLSHDLFNLYVALELASLSGVGMVALAGGVAALRAQMRYLLYATVGSLFYLLGVALLYAETGVLDLALIGEAVGPTPPSLAALILMTLGLLLKTAIWPLHFWLPPAHSSAPPAVSAVLSALVVKASLYLLIRLWFDVFPDLSPGAAWNLLGLLGAAAVLWGSFLALRQERLKLMIAYSTVAQLGYMLFVFPLAMPGSLVAHHAWNGAVLQMLSHGLAKAAMFLSAGAIVAALGSDARADLVGGSRRVPLPLFALALAGLSIMGLPPSGGFVAKWLLLRAALTTGNWWLVAVLTLGGLIAAAYLLRFLLPAFRPVPHGVPPHRIGTGTLGTSALTLALMSVLLGFATEPVLRLLDMARPAALGVLS